ncbi:hypothetical protein Ahia01_001009500 [Argonauta hians]
MAPQRNQMRSKNKKHKKIKAIDPFYKGDRKNVYDKKDVNWEPDGDEDRVPRMWKELMQLKEKYSQKKPNKAESSDDIKVGDHSNKDKFGGVMKKIKEFQKKKKQEKAAADDDDEGACDKGAPLYIPLVKGEEESAKSYLNRTEREAKKVFQQNRLSGKYNIQYDDVTGNKTKTVIKAKKKKRLKELTKLKKEKKEEYKNRNNTGFEHFKDNVVFGEVAMAPPVIKAKPRKAEVTNVVPRPGSKQLLLKKILEQNTESKPEKNLQKKPKDKKTTKLKYLSLAKQNMLSLERERVVKLYREIKKKNHEANKKKF